MRDFKSSFYPQEKIYWLVKWKLHFTIGRVYWLPRPAWASYFCNMLLTFFCINLWLQKIKNTLYPMSPVCSSSWGSHKLITSTTLLKNNSTLTLFSAALKRAIALRGISVLKMSGTFSKGSWEWKQSSVKMSVVQNLIFYGNNIYSSTKINYTLPMF